MFEFFRKAPLEKKSAAPLIALSLQGRARWGGRDAASLARIGVMQNAIAYACVRKIASAAASVPWLLYDGAAELESHPLLACWRGPTFRGWRRPVRALYAFLQMAGNAYLESITLDGTPRELHVLRRIVFLSWRGRAAGRWVMTTGWTAR